MKNFRKFISSNKRTNLRLVFQLSLFTLFAVASLFLWQTSAKMQDNDSVAVNPQPAILGATSASNRAVVFPDPFAAPTTQNLVPGLPAGAQHPHPHPHPHPTPHPHP